MLFDKATAKEFLHVYYDFLFEDAKRKNKRFPVMQACRFTQSILDVKDHNFARYLLSEWQREKGLKGKNEFFFA
jgi:hypothetical protein